MAYRRFEEIPSDSDDDNEVQFVRATGMMGGSLPDIPYMYPFIYYNYFQVL